MVKCMQQYPINLWYSQVFDKDCSGFLEAEEFREILPLLGENVPQNKVDAAIRAVDTDGSGRSDEIPVSLAH